MPNITGILTDCQKGDNCTKFKIGGIWIKAWLTGRGACETPQDAILALWNEGALVDYTDTEKDGKTYHNAVKVMPHDVSPSDMVSTNGETDWDRVRQLDHLGKTQNSLIAAHGGYTPNAREELETAWDDYIAIYNGNSLGIVKQTQEAEPFNRNQAMLGVVNDLKACGWTVATIEEQLKSRYAIKLIAKQKLSETITNTQLADAVVWAKDIRRKHNELHEEPGIEDL